MHREHVVEIRADGTFEPAILEIDSEDTVIWTLSNSGDAVVRARRNAEGQIEAAPVSLADPNDFAKPQINADGGIYCMSDDEYPYQIEDEIWQADGINGVYLRLLWSDLETTPATFDFSVLDSIFDRAVRSGKKISISVKAGFKGTPGWLFSDQYPWSVPALKFKGQSAKPIGSPCEDLYMYQYIAMLAKLAEHVRSRNDWWQRIAYIKPSGANRWSAEGVLPWKGDNPAQTEAWLREWATTGHYTPARLYAYFEQQLIWLQRAFPGKTQAYQLIQNGYPIINNQGQYKGQPGVPSSALPGPFEQTQTIINAGSELLGLDWAVQHNGLQPIPSPNVCPAPDHIDPSFHYTGSGCPNKWAQAAYLDNGSPTGYQTAHVESSGIGRALVNLWKNSNGIFFETYQSYLLPWLGGQTISGSPGNLSSWNEHLLARRRELFPQLPDPTPSSTSHIFTRTQAGERPQKIWVLNPRTQTRMLVRISPNT